MMLGSLMKEKLYHSLGRAGLKLVEGEMDDDTTKSTNLEATQHSHHDAIDGSHFDSMRNCDVHMAYGSFTERG